MRLLLNTCRKTLQTVALDPTDPHCEQLALRDIQAPSNDFAAYSSTGDFNLSQNNSIRALQILMHPPDTTSSFLEHALPTIRSSGHEDQPLPCELSRAERGEGVSRHRRQLEVFREAHEVLDFELELCVTIWGSAGKGALRIFGEAVVEEKVKNRFNDFSFNPYAGYSPQRSRL